MTTNFDFNSAAVEPSTELDSYYVNEEELRIRLARASMARQEFLTLRNSGKRVNNAMRGIYADWYKATSEAKFMESVLSARQRQQYADILSKL